MDCIGDHPDLAAGPRHPLYGISACALDKACLVSTLPAISHAASTACSAPSGRLAWSPAASRDFFLLLSSIRKHQNSPKASLIQVSKE